MTTGYKAAFNYKCLNQKYAVGETYKTNEKPIICKQGFHYCRKLNNVFMFYPMSWKTNVFEIKDLSEDTVTGEKWAGLPPIKSATNNMEIVQELYDIDIIEIIGLKHYWEEKNMPYEDKVKILTYRSVGGYWITKVYNDAKDPIFYVDSFGFMAKYKDVYGENIATEVINPKLKILYMNKTPNQVFDETYRKHTFFKVDHDLDVFKNGFQQQMFDMLGIKQL